MNSLVVSKLNKKLGSKYILENISLSITKGELVALLGPNGAGKTTLLKTIIGLYQSTPPSQSNEKNTILFKGTTINAWPISKRVSAGLAYLPQHTSLFQHMSVSENLQLVYEYQDYWQRKDHLLFL